MMNRVALLFFVGILLISGCRQDKEVFTPDEDELVLFQTDLMGVVIDENGMAIPTVSIDVDGTSALSDANGVFKLEDINVKNGKLFVRATKSGYFEGSRTAFPIEDRGNFVKIRLLQKVDRGTVDGVLGGRIDLPGDVRFTFPDNGVVNAASGAAHTGDVHVNYQYLDPNNDNILELMPGNLLGRRLDGSEQFLTTYGMMAVELTDDSGNKLQIASGKNVIVDAPVPAGINNSAGQIPLWSFNEESGSWEEESIATITGDMMSGNLSHFSWWNFDLPVEQVIICGHVDYADNGALFTPVSAFIMGCICRAEGLEGKPAVCGYTDDNGDFKARVPVGETFELKFKDECGNIIATFDIGPFTEDSEIGPFSIDQPVEAFSDISGRLLDCNGDPVTNGYVLIHVGVVTQFIEVNADGTFMGRVQVCDETTFDFIGVDINNIKQSLTSTRPVEPIIELGDIEVCDDLDEYLITVIDGISSVTVDISQSYSASENFTQISTGLGQDTARNLFMSYEGADVGTYTAASIEGSTPNDEFIFCGNQGGTFSVTVLTHEAIGGYIEGTFAGDMCQTNGGSNTVVTGSFRVIREE